MSELRHMFSCRMQQAYIDYVDKHKDLFGMSRGAVIEHAINNMEPDRFARIGVKPGTKADNITSEGEHND